MVLAQPGNNQYAAKSSFYKPYLKRVFVIHRFGGFCGQFEHKYKHEVLGQDTYFIFNVSDEYEYVKTSNVIDGYYFDCWIEHVDKHDNVIKKELLEVQQLLN